jgi:hypothetical protein
VQIGAIGTKSVLPGLFCSKLACMKSKLLIIFFLFLLAADSFSQKIKEKNIVSFRIYNYQSFPEGKHFEDFTSEDIAKMTYYQVPADSIKGAIGSPRNIILSPFFKGTFFATVDLKNGVRKKLKISTYGEFYVDLNSNKIFIIREKNKKKFGNILKAASRYNNPD